ncbi:MULTISPECIES: hypothetical protein [unclassified Streptomyces]|uniref:hypothetical protein n=1 Tax=unclassified Streptomyces TaxID=2593676 RepID=UPI00278C3768|nr:MULTISPECIES: hypothetical protein [unclassified Streptomyces]
MIAPTVVNARKALITTAMGVVLRVPKRPMRGEAAAPKENWATPSSADIVPGAARPRLWPTALKAGKRRPKEATVISKHTQKDHRCSVPDALVLIKARAFRDGTTTSDVANRIVHSGLRLTGESG